MMIVSIYFSKIQFDERNSDGNICRSILLDLIQRELSYQVYKWNKQMPSIDKTELCEIGGEVWQSRMGLPAKIIRSSSSSFKPRKVLDEQYSSQIVFSYGIILSEEQYRKLLVYCDALEYEPYRDKKMSIRDDGCIGYRDEINLHFTGITDSYIPKMEWDMPYYHAEDHIWPSEKLYRYLVLNYLQCNKKIKGWGAYYGESSQPCL